jgi:protein-S-isoprenylcysteine O-methyltransferase Ste14
MWSTVSWPVSLVGNVLIMLGFLIDFFVFRENSYGASTIETFEDQRVVSTGLYALIRHPMYMGVLTPGDPASSVVPDPQIVRLAA